MSKGLLDPKVDFVFKNIFGSEKNPEILISFLASSVILPSQRGQTLVKIYQVKLQDNIKINITDKMN